MSINIRFSICLVSVFLLFSCGKKEYTEILDRAHRQLENKEYSEAYNMLSLISFDDVVGCENRARFALLYSSALDKNKVDIKSDSLIRFAVDYYEKRGSDLYKAKVYYYLGRIYNNNKNIELCVENYILAKEHVPEKAHYSKGLIYSDLGNQYKDQHSFRMAIENYAIAAESFRQVGETEQEIFNMLKVGDCYSAQKEYDDALSVYEKAVVIAQPTNDTTNILKIEKRIAISKFLLKEPIAEIKRDLTTLYNEYNKGAIVADHYSMWAQIYIRESNLDSAKYFVLKNINSNSPRSARQTAGLYDVLKRVEEARGNYDQALKYGDIVYSMMDSINIADKELLVQVLEEKYENRSLKESYTVLARRNNRHLFIWFLSILGLVSLIVYIIYKRQLISDSEALLNLQHRYQFLLSRSQSSDAQEIHAINRLGEVIDDVGHSFDSGGKCKVFVKRILTYFANIIGYSSKDSETYIYLRYLANKKGCGIIDFLQKKYNLSIFEIDLCSMICLGLSTDSIRVLLRHANNCVIHRKSSKLSVKFGLTSGDSLAQFLKSETKKLSKNRVV